MVRREQNVKTYEKMSSTCHNNRYKVRRSMYSNVFLKLVRRSASFRLRTGDTSEHFGSTILRMEYRETSGGGK
jgi:hypothetical protein